MNILSPDLKDKIKGIKLLAMDVDGVLTDGGVYILEDGREFRRFDIKDGLGIKQVKDKGIRIAVISSSICPAVEHRMQKLGVQEVHLGVQDKLHRLREICTKLAIDLGEVCYIGDDLADLAVMNAVGLPCAPADATQSVKKISLYIANSQGGKGAVREICDLFYDLPSHGLELTP